MPNGNPDQLGFNRSVNVALGATASNKVAIVGVTQPKRKYLNSIYVGVSNGTAVAPLFENYLIKVCVCSDASALLGSPTLLTYNPLNSAGSENLNLGTRYYEQALILPYNNLILFDAPILFDEGERIYVVASTPYAANDTLLTVPNRNVFLSANGYFVDSDQVKYKFR